MTQKGDPYAKLFSTLSGVIFMSCVLSQLNILCNNLLKPHFTNMLGPISQMQLKGCHTNFKKGAAMVFRLHSRHVELLLTY